MGQGKRANVLWSLHQQGKGGGKTVDKMIDKQQNIGIKLTKLQSDGWKQWLKVPWRAER